MTRAFVRSIKWWQHAMVSATAWPNAVALLPFGELEEAAFDRTAAESWVGYVETLIDSIQASVESAVESPETEKWRGVLADLRLARACALEHAQSFGAGEPSPR
jgi:hypothetical protein